MGSRSTAALSVAVLLALAAPAHPQTAAPPPTPNQTQTQTQPQPPASQQPYTFRADTRVVLTDVTVTDRNGNPVHGLPQSAFRITDNKKPQAIASFEEHAGLPPAPAPLPAAAHGVYSNDYLLHLPPVLNVIVLDTTNLELPDQMYLHYELTRYFKESPLSQPLAIYLRNGNGTFLLQNFTTDRALLLAALHKAIPRFPPHGREFLSDVDTLHQIAVYLSQIPGRKNVLWYSGGSTIFLIDDPSRIENLAAWRGIYDELEQGRIAIYPVDARGLTVFSSRTQTSQHLIMDEVARSTGGHAYYNTNGLLQTAGRVVSSGASFYTLTYSPRDLRFDNKWHKVEVKVEGASYDLSYRRGYFADGSLPAPDQPDQPAKKRTRLTLDGEKIDEPELRSAPIIFEAHVLPLSDPSIGSLSPASASVPPKPPKRGQLPFLVRYAVPVSALTVEKTGGKQKIHFGIASFAFNSDGGAIAREGAQLNMTVNDESLRLHPDANVLIDQQLNLAKGDEYLYLAVWDTASNRLGTLQIALNIPKPK